MIGLSHCLVRRMRGVLRKIMLSFAFILSVGGLHRQDFSLLQGLYSNLLDQQVSHKRAFRTAISKPDRAIL
jgi:hypothetical protein